MSQTKNEVEKRTLRAAPAIDIYENDDHVLILADLPGVEKGAVDVQVDDRELTIRATKKTKDGDAVQYQRTFTMPRHLDPTSTGAELRDGVLHLRLPKRETAKPRRIVVRAS
jgi:HSP20 family molecular chaperone IbpA